MPTATTRSAAMATVTATPQPTNASRTVIHTLPSGMPTERTITAAYFKEYGRLTVLRTGDHQDVYAVCTDRLVSIERKPAA